MRYLWPAELIRSPWDHCPFRAGINEAELVRQTGGSLSMGFYRFRRKGGPSNVQRTVAKLYQGRET